MLSNICNFTFIACNIQIIMLNIIMCTISSVIYDLSAAAPLTLIVLTAAAAARVTEVQEVLFQYYCTFVIPRAVINIKAAVRLDSGSHRPSLTNNTMNTWNTGNLLKNAVI